MESSGCPHKNPTQAASPIANGNFSNPCFPSRSSLGERRAIPSATSSMPSSLPSAAVVPGGCCRTTCRPSGLSMTTSWSGGAKDSGRRCTTPCATRCACAAEKKSPDRCIDRGLKQTELAQLLAVVYQTVEKWEHNLAPMNAKSRARVVAFLGYDPAAPGVNPTADSFGD